MHILLVNDDGIGSDGILALAREALSRGHRVSMVAPQRQQSAAGQHISLIDPIFVKEYDMGLPLAAAYGVAGTPTDCVRLALFALIQEPIDLVMSGINDGYNAGMAVYYSGTVGAAREAALGKRHSMAVSIHHRATATMLAHLARYAVRLGERYAGDDIRHRHPGFPGASRQGQYSPARLQTELLLPGRVQRVPVRPGHARARG